MEAYEIWELVGGKIRDEELIAIFLDDGLATDFVTILNDGQHSHPDVCYYVRTVAGHTAAVNIINTCVSKEIG